MQVSQWPPVPQAFVLLLLKPDQDFPNRKQPCLRQEILDLIKPGDLMNHRMRQKLI